MRAVEKPDYGQAVQQIVYRNRSGVGMSPLYYSEGMSERVRFDLISRLNLGLFVNADSDPELAGCFDLHYSVHEAEAVLIYRKSVVEDNRRTSFAHVLIGDPGVLSSDNVVPMLKDWRFRTERDPSSNHLYPITPDEFRQKAADLRRQSQDASPLPVLNRLIVEWVLYGAKGLVVKVRPGFRAALIAGLHDQLGAAALAGGFSFHEVDYDDSQRALPRLSFISERANSYMKVSRHVIDLDAPLPGGPEAFADLAEKLTEAFKKNQVEKFVKKNEVNRLLADLGYAELQPTPSAPPETLVVPTSADLPGATEDDRRTQFEVTGGESQEPQADPQVAPRPQSQPQPQLQQWTQPQQGLRQPAPDPKAQPQSQVQQPQSRQPVSQTAAGLTSTWEQDAAPEYTPPGSAEQPPKKFDPLDVVPIVVLLVAVLVIAALLLQIGRFR